MIPDAAALPRAMQAVQALRAAGISVQMHAALSAGADSMKTQFKKADASGAAHALIFGGDELAENSVTVKALRAGGAAQRRESLADMASWASTLQSRT